MPSATTPISPDHLASVVEVAAAYPELPCIVRVRLFDDDVELGWLALDPDAHPLEWLVGARAPDDWAAIGVAATGRLHHLDDRTTEPVRVVTAHVVSRDGNWASLWQPVDGPSTVIAGAACDPSRPEGRIDEACRRVLDLSTPAPSVGTTVLWSTQWLDRLVATAATASGRRRLRRWPDVARLHPAVEALLPDDAETPTPDQLGGLAANLAAWRDWTALRRSCATGAWKAPELSAVTAAWLDDGAFSRWVLGAYPDPEELCRTIVDLLPGHIVESVISTMHRSGSA